MKYTYSPNDPYCLLHEHGHWTKDCKQLTEVEDE